MKKLKCSADQLICLVMLSCLVLTALAETPNRYESALAGWARVLDRHVDEQGRIDFHAVAKEPDDLRRFIQIIENFGPASHPEIFNSRQKMLMLLVLSLSTCRQRQAGENGVNGRVS